LIIVRRSMKASEYNSIFTEEFVTGNLLFERERERKTEQFTTMTRT
jgi:hypothetical protein